MLETTGCGGPSPGQAGSMAFKRSGVFPARGPPNLVLDEGAQSRRRAVACNAGAVRRRGRGLYPGDDGQDSFGMGDVHRRRREVIDYVTHVQPGEVQAFIDEAPPTVVAAMKQTVSNMVGTLPPQQFSVTISTVAESLASLMQTMLRTGYLLRGVQYQLELELALQSAAASMMQHTNQQQQQQAAEVAPRGGCASTSALPASPGVLAGPPQGSSPTSSLSSSSSSTLIPEVVGAGGSAAVAAEGGGVDSAASAGALDVRGWAGPEEQYAPGVQLSRVEGDVLRWHMNQGLERMPAASYIRFLEQKVAELQQQVQQQQQQAAQQQAAAAAASGFQPFPPLFNTPAAPGTPLGRGPAAAGVAGVAAASMLAAASAAGGMDAGALQGAAGAMPNPVLTYLRSLDAPSLAALGQCGPDVSEAMTLFVARLMGTTEHEQLRQMTSEFTAIELSKLLFWLLVVGWSLRAMEVRMEVEEGFGSA